MKENEFLDGVSNIEPDVVERFVSMDNKLQKKANKPKSKGIWLRFGAIAACFVLIVSAVIVVPMLREDDPGNIQFPDVPIWDSAQYSAEDISELFSARTYDAASVNAYTKIFVPDSDYLYVDEVCGEEYLGLYQYNETENNLSKKDFQAFINDFLPKLADSINATVPQYEISENNHINGNSFSVSTDIDSYNMLILQNETSSAFSLYKLSGDRKIILDGETIQIDQRLSDDEIINSIQSIKNKLFGIFNVSFSDTKIIRSFDSYSKHGAEFISIYFYDETAHPLNSFLSRPISDYICISFDNASNYSGDIVSDSILTVADIDYNRRNDITEEYTLIENAKKISLEDAEALLYNGYVFGGHSCPLCMAAQEKVSFEGYDSVDIEYVFGYDSQTGKSTIGMPFYAFYKKIGTAENGNLIYAKTYVAAIEVSGYAEYFESQKSNHQNADGYEIG